MPKSPTERNALLGQRPFAVVVSCTDQPIPAWRLFGDDPGIRIVAAAGGVVDDLQTSRIEHACRVEGAAALVVLGHTGCEAVRQGVFQARRGVHTRLARAMGGLASGLPLEGGRMPRSVLDALIERNVERALQSLRDLSSIVAALELGGRLRLAAALYDEDRGEVEFLPTVSPHRWPAPDEETLA
ncbi:MAG: hypothetical protein KC645_18970 [Gemmatimonadetes bacterium]|nr:hypothetical protein [Gemmatimonadota bacterium]